MKIVRGVIVVAISSVLTGLWGMTAFGQTGNSQPVPAADKPSKQAVPPYHSKAPSGPLPNTLDPKQFDNTETQNIYALAAKVKKLLYQEPCYCGCDKEVGHKSLLDCYTDFHATGCEVCKKEAVFAATESQKGKTPAQIRKEIIAGDWHSTDLSLYGAAPESR